MRVLLLESFYGGSHRDVADNLAARSRHDITLETMPARFWKWRMRASAFEFAHRIADPRAFDLVVCSGLITLSDLRSVWGAALPPILLYSHETQLSYPVPNGEEIDAHFGMTDLANMVCADHVAFNSASHRGRFLSEVPAFLRRLPDFRPMWITDRLEKKSSICYPGITVRDGRGTALDETASAEVAQADSPGVPDDAPLVVWNHRWEFDKNPAAFFGALAKLADDGIPFRLAVLGENFQMKPKGFLTARQRFSDRVVAWGFEPSKERYLDLLAQGDVVVSTSIQENFGISTLEAIAAGCFPVLPRRLSYPEIIPESFHDRCLYDSEEHLVAKLRDVLTRHELRANCEKLIAHARSFSWSQRIGQFDTLFEKVAKG